MQKQPKIYADDRISMTCLHFNAVMDIFARGLLAAFHNNVTMTEDEASSLALEYAEDIERRNVEQFKQQNRSKRK